jgi:hypothetical protein
VKVLLVVVVPPKYNTGLVATAVPEVVAQVIAAPAACVFAAIAGVCADTVVVPVTEFCWQNSTIILEVPSQVNGVLKLWVLTPTTALNEACENTFVNAGVSKVVVRAVADV